MDSRAEGGFRKVGKWFVGVSLGRLVPIPLFAIMAWVQFSWRVGGHRHHKKKPPTLLGPGVSRSECPWALFSFRLRHLLQVPASYLQQVSS